MTSDYATPRWLVAVAEELETIARDVRTTGRERAAREAARLRRMADILEQRI